MYLYSRWPHSWDELKAFQPSHFPVLAGEPFSCNRRAYGTAKTTSLGVNHSLPVRNSVFSGACSSSARGEKGDFSDILQAASPYMEMFTHHTDLLEGKEVTQGLGEAGFEFLFPETKLPPSPLPLPLHSFAPCSGSQGESVSVLPLGPGDHLLAVGLRVCEREWVPVEGRLPVGPDGAWVHQYCQSQWHLRPQTLGSESEGWLAWAVMGRGWECGCFHLGSGRVLPQGNTSHSGI